MSQTVDTLSAKQKEFTDAQAQKSNYLAQIVSGLKQLRSEKKKTQCELDELRGALNVLNGTLDMVKQELTPASSTQASEVASVAPVEVTPEVAS